MTLSTKPIPPVIHRARSRSKRQSHATPVRLAAVGCGWRLGSYLKQLSMNNGAPMRIVAMADPNSEAIKHYRRSYGLNDVHVFETGPQMLESMGDQLDALIITSPNVHHRETMEPAVMRGLTTLLEKPVATSVADCAAMWRTYLHAGQPPLTVGFVLRYAPFYRKAKELIDNGSVGQVLTVQATEEMDASLSSGFMRQWRRKTSIAGPLVLEKCSHDMDVLSWLIGDKPKWISSFAQRTRFMPDPRAANYCGDCSLAPDCRYSPNNLTPYALDADQLLYAKNPALSQNSDLCVFNAEKDVPDHQVVNLEFENGVLATFSLAMDQPITTRTLKIHGTHGQIIGDIRRNRMQLITHATHRSGKARTIEIDIVHDGSGHDGADSGITRHFTAMATGRPTEPWPGLKEGIEACLVSFAADRASRTRGIIAVDDLRSTVFQATD